MAIIWTEEVGKGEHCCEDPLSQNDCATKDRAWLFKLKKSHQMHSLVFSFFLYYKQNDILVSKHSLISEKTVYENFCFIYTNT